MAYTVFSGWKEHFIAQGGEQRGFALKPANLAYLNLKTYDVYERLLPFGILANPSGRVVLLLSAERAWREGAEALFHPYVAISEDGGKTFPESFPIPGLCGRPVSLGQYTDQHFVFRCAVMENGKKAIARVFSYDGGVTWPDRRIEEPSPLINRVMASEGNPMLVCINGEQEMWEIVCDSKGHPTSPSSSFLRRYQADGRFTDSPTPDAWRWVSEAGGVRYDRAVDEGSLAYRADGVIVAALRTNMLPAFFSGVHDDSLEGLAVATLSPDGERFSPLRVLYSAGRHHAHLLPLPNRELLLTNILRTDVRNGELKSFRRGCEAMVSSGGGETFDPEQKYMLDWYNYLHDGSDWVNGMCGHCASAHVGDSILTVYGNYQNRGATLIRWKPEGL